VLAPNEFAFISDQTKGNINVYVGPYKTSLANTDKPVIFDELLKRFEKCNLEESIQTFSTAPEGWYLVLKNPPLDNKQPKTGTSNSLPDLQIGRKVNIPGPVFFALWPGQMVRVIPGHHLRSNQYLLVRVYDEEEARRNWGKAVIKTKSGADIESETPDEVTGKEEIPDLTIGKTLVIKGDMVSFYIPPTGVEVVRDGYSNYVREAVTLERLEYCILLDESGNKRYIQGPAVVFPEPTEEFVKLNGYRKFKAIELNENSGLYIKVIAPYKEGKTEYDAGSELFITGKDTMIYYPRPEHAIIKYGGREKHYAVAIPAGEGRYYMNRNTGQIYLKKGPSIFLPDPREEVFVRRVLHPKQVALWFPGNAEALAYNRQLQVELERKQRSDQFYIEDSELQALQSEAAPAPAQASEAPKLRKKEATSEEMASDEFSRSQSFTQPRSIVLDTKYEGAVTINLWTGYAVQVVSKTGTRKVIVGPQTYLLEYDESLEAMELSTGVPKTEQDALRTVYLRVLHNKISDLIRAESKDYTQVSIYLSYRVNFEGDPELWFNVENYVKFLTDHMRSFVRNAVKKHDIMAFYANGIDILRDTVLGKELSKDGKRQGRIFEENGMRIYDVEVLDIRLSDATLESLLVQSQQDVVKQTLRIEAEKRKLTFTQESEQISQSIAEAESATKQKKATLEAQEITQELQTTLTRLQAEIEARHVQLKAEVAEQEHLDQVKTAELARERQEVELSLEVAQRELEQYIQEVRAEVKAVVEKAQAVSPDLVAALQAFSDKALAQKMADSMAPLAILGGKSIAEVFANLLKGTQVAHVLKRSAELLDQADEEQD
jgi:major vault protein